MIIDLILALLLVIAAVKGYRKGLVVAVFSILAFIIGLAAAIKLSVVVASYIGQATNISEQWLPFISFGVVFVVVILLVRWVGAIIQKGVEIALLGWINRVGGMLIYAVLYLIIYSILLFYAEQVSLLKQDTISASVTYAYIKPWGPAVIDKIGTILPFFKNMFAELQQFFEGVSHKIPVSQ